MSNIQDEIEKGLKAVTLLQEAADLLASIPDHEARLVGGLIRAILGCIDANCVEEYSLVSYEFCKKKLEDAEKGIIH